MFTTIYAIAGDTRVYTQGDGIIMGVQGRYMFILLTMLPALLSPMIKKIFGGQSMMKKTIQEKYICSLVIKLSLFGAFLTSFAYFYVTGYLLF